MLLRDAAPLSPDVPSSPRAEAARAPAAAPGVVIGRLAGFTDHGRTPLVTSAPPGDAVARRARTTIDLHGGHVGREVVLAHEAGDPSRPIILGVLREPPLDGPFPPPAGAAGTWQLRVDGERCVLSARHELVLECGRSRLVLRADGRAELHGETVITEAKGANKVRGGSVQLN